MDKQYEGYAASRLDGDFGEMSSWRFVYPYLKNKRVLDVGCSDGLYLKYMADGSKGIEQVSSLAEAGKNRGLNIINGDVLGSIAELSDGEFEGALFSHVMEHVDSPILLLRNIQRVLEPGGTLVLGLPIERNVFRDLLRLDYFNGTHIYAFSVRNARRLLEETGFKIDKIFFHLPKCRGPVGHTIERFWNLAGWPLREYFSMAYWIVAKKM
ncbi:MAG: class I SAM-dependent methyltransferase [Candidatus Accumulibacter necessarius]|jgi:SAM-dependent methyltransferase|uniref:class I SAM-dependent methyltransferase n=1 Tax=Candidatus Accumulibacter necessarius TaxID=2954386 RepID=UPI002FC2E06E